MKKGVILILSIVMLVAGWTGSAVGQPTSGVGFDPLVLDPPGWPPLLFGSAYRYDRAAEFFDTWIWLAVVSNDARAHIQFYDPKCTRTNDQTVELTENESTLLFASEAAPDSAAGVFLVESDCRVCALLGQVWYLDFDDGIVFSRALYAPGVFNLVWSFFETEHWDTIAQGFDTFATHLWLNCPTGRDGRGTTGNTALYDDLKFGRLIDFSPFFRFFGGANILASSTIPTLGLFMEMFVPANRPGASLADFVLINFDESPGGSRDDIPCSCLTDGPLTSFSGLFHDFFGLLRVRFKTSTGEPAVGLVHKTEGAPGLEIFDQRFHPLVPFFGVEP